MTEINDYLKAPLPQAVAGVLPPSASARFARRVRSRSPIRSSPPTAAKHILITFGVPVPVKTDPRGILFLSSATGLPAPVDRWCNHRVDEAPRIKRLPAVVPVVQDRLAATEENRSRFAEAVETALRFGKGKVAFITQPSAQALPFSTGWHCAHCDIDSLPPFPGSLQLQSSARRLPDVPGFWAHDRPRPGARPSRSFAEHIAQGVVKAVPNGEVAGVSAGFDALRGEEGHRYDVPFRKFCPKPEQEWVLHGEKTGATLDELWNSGQWYGVKGFFDWLETKSYKMHVRRAPEPLPETTRCCPDCHGGRYQPATLNFPVRRQAGFPDLMIMPVDKLAEMCEAREAAGGNDATTAIAARGGAFPPAVSRGSGARVSFSRSSDPHAQRWGSGARESHDVPRGFAGEYAFRPRRAEHRLAPARYRAAHPRDASTARTRAIRSSWSSMTKR